MVRGNVPFPSTTLSWCREGWECWWTSETRTMPFSAEQASRHLELEERSIWKNVSLDSRNGPAQSLNSEFLYSDPFEGPTCNCWIISLSLYLFPIYLICAVVYSHPLSTHPLVRRLQQMRPCLWMSFSDSDALGKKEAVLGSTFWMVNNCTI